MRDVTRIVGDIQYKLTKSKDKYLVYVYERFSQELICLLRATEKSKAVDFYTRLLHLYGIEYSHREVGAT